MSCPCHCRSDVDKISMSMPHRSPRQKLVASCWGARPGQGEIHLVLTRLRLVYRRSQSSKRSQVGGIRRIRGSNGFRFCRFEKNRTCREIKSALNDSKHLKSCRHVMKSDEMWVCPESGSAKCTQIPTDFGHTMTYPLLPTYVSWAFSVFIDGSVVWCLSSPLRMFSCSESESSNPSCIIQ